MKGPYKVLIVIIVLALVSAFTAVSAYTEPASISLSPGETPYNQLSSYVYNSSNYNYKVGYMNFSDYGNSVSYVYAILPLQGLKLVSHNFTGPFLYFSLYKVSQKLGFPFSDTALSVHMQFQPSEYLEPQVTDIVPDIQQNQINTILQGSFANQVPSNVQNITIWVNVTVNAYFDIGPYYISEGTQTHLFQFSVIFSNTTKS